LELPRICCVLGCNEPPEVVIRGLIAVYLCQHHAERHPQETLKLDPAKIPALFVPAA